MEFDIKDTRAKDNSQKSRSSNIVLQGLARIMFHQKELRYWERQLAVTSVTRKDILALLADGFELSRILQKVGSATEASCTRLQVHSRSKRAFLRRGRNSGAI